MMFQTDQKILVNCSGGRFNQLCEHAIRMAQLLKRELCLFYYRPKISTADYEQFSQQIEKYTEAIGLKHPQLPVSSVILQGKFSSFEESLTNQYQCILFITSREDSKEIRRSLQEIRFPVMFLSEAEKHQTAYKKVMLPVDWTPKNKESAPWASYMARFNRSEITLLIANEKDSINIEEVEKNLHSINRFFRQFPFSYKTQNANSSSWKLHNELIERACNHETDLIIFMASRSVNLIDKLIGIPEDKVIMNSTVPVICLNPNREYYLLCE